MRRGGLGVKVEWSQKGLMVCPKIKWRFLSGLKGLSRSAMGRYGPRLRVGEMDKWDLVYYAID